MKFKYLVIVIIAVAMAALTGCHGDAIDADYNSNTCETLAIKIERRDSLSQHDYAQMIGQNEAILRYLVEESKRVSGEPDSLRSNAWRNLLADPAYLERFGYMFTLGSALYQADVDGKLDKQNKRAYDALDQYNSQLAEYASRN